MDVARLLDFMTASNDVYAAMDMSQKPSPPGLFKIAKHEPSSSSNSQPGTPAMSDRRAVPACAICGTDSTGIHFGVDACAACSAFFRRTVVLNKDYSCTKGGNCTVVKEQRTMAEVLAKDRNALKGCFLLGYLPGLSAMETYRNITETLGEGIISYKTTITWFKKFKEENYNLDDKSHSGRPRLDIDDDISDVLEDEPRSSVRVVSSHTRPSFATIFRHQKESGRTAEYGQVISHELADSQLKLRCDLSQSLLSRKCSFNYISSIVKRDMHEKKVMLSVWWDRNGVICYELLSDYLALTDYHLFRSLQNSFSGQKFDYLMQVKSDLDRFFSSQPSEFYAAGIAKLPQCWRDVTSTHGQYITY
ncbi:hypothetical protein CRE_10181 [Caenorhabditis remanei]|uniref:Nuclear receptor domain-containing protein n=1 Tax=Caenorhabditis remanei TaxID=31234 RepID=E3M6R4_CAERE|nr:hypothetical protein CRE_10181 [Caenorhabditis remanei]